MEAAKEIANKVIFVMEGMKTPNRSLPPSIIQIEVATFNNLGLVSLTEGTKESVKSAIEYFEKLRDISKDMALLIKLPLTNAMLSLPSPSVTEVPS